MREVLIRTPDDFHVHFRSPPELALYARRTAAFFDRALPMPNTVPPIADGRTVAEYTAAIRSAAPSLGLVPTFKLLPGMTAETVRGCAAAGARVGKYYPEGASTNAEDGIRDPGEIRDALRALEETGLILAIHGEDPSAPLFDRERAFLPVVESLLSAHPRLRIVLEHLSTRAAADFVARGPGRLGATVTAHHLAFTADDLAGTALDPHLFCKPLLQNADNRAALRSLVRDCPRVFFGSDSAPHPRSKKESGGAPAGIYSAPVALSLLAAVFEEEGAMDRLEDFVSRKGAEFYGLPPNSGRIRLSRRPWTVPEEIDGVVPAARGRTLNWITERV
ncbi:MAG TPA: amidohydrolase family protein [Magnetospirillaceae bacterium]|nr:amidohydrolase family protein [Magnetospirillaceae bacterium]